MPEDSSPENEVHSEVAKHQERDGHGRFFSKDKKEERAPSLFQHPANTDSNKSEDPPLVSLKVTNPVTYFKIWWKRIIANEGIDFRFRIKPLTAIAIAVVIVSVLTGTGFTIARYYSVPLIVPNSFVNIVSYTGTIQKSDNQYILITQSSQAFILKSSTQDLNKLVDKKVLVTGKLNNQTNTIEINQISSI